MMTKFVSEQQLIDMLDMLESGFIREDAERGEQERVLELGKMDVDELDTGQVEPSLNGYIHVEDDGKISVVNPKNGGDYPTISAQAPIILFVNDKEVEGNTKVTSSSEIEWKMEEKPLYEITISEDELEAFITIHHTKRYAWTLNKPIPSLHVVLTAKEDESTLLETISLDDILTEIEALQIKMNINIAAIQAEMNNPTHQPVAIAHGKAPVQGKDAQLELYFSEHIEKSFVEVGGVVDYKNHVFIPSVKNGDTIARKNPPVEGKTGYNVYGDILFPEKVNDIRIAGKDNVEITPDFTVIARKKGRPRITGNKVKYFDINTAHVVPGNVDLSTGNIVFAGDVIVYGDVMDNMIIESLGNIYVTGNVFRSTLTATGSIVVKGNVLGSKLYSGYFGMLYNRLYNCSKQLIDILEDITASAYLLMREIHKKKMRVRYGQVLLLIIENKHRKLWDEVKDLLSAITSLQIYNNNALQQLKDYLELFLMPVKIVEVMSAHRMKELMRLLKDAFMRVVLSKESQVQVEINQSQNSTIKSNGDIYIRKEGIVQCELYSKENIIFFQDESVCRGSTLEAGNTISAMIVGGITGAGTCLKAKNKVIVKKMYEGKVTIDRYSVDIFEPVEEVEFDRNQFRRSINVGVG